MAGPGSAFDLLNGWVNNLTSLQSLCINHALGAGIDQMTLNAFAQAIVTSTVNNVNNFLQTVATAFPNTIDPNDPNFTPGDQTDFADITDWVSPSSLQHSVISFVWSSTGGSALPSTQTIPTLFSDTDWTAFTAAIARTNLDAVLGDPPKVMTNLAAFHAAGSTKTFTDLVNFLLTIQPVPAKGAAS